jgi:hypothetical protein
MCWHTCDTLCSLLSSLFNFSFLLQTTLRLFVLLRLIPPVAHGIMNSQPILLQRLNKNDDKPRANCFQDKNANKLPSLQEPSDGRLANFVQPRASHTRTTKDKTAYCCTPIINGKKIFLRTLKRYLQQSWARDPEDSKSKPMVRALEHRANGEPSLVVGRGRVSWMMLSLIALTRQKQLTKSRQAASQPASQR